MREKYIIKIKEEMKSSNLIFQTFLSVYLCELSRCSSINKGKTSIKIHQVFQLLSIESNDTKNFSVVNQSALFMLI